MKKLGIRILMCFIVLTSCTEDPSGSDLTGNGILRGKVVDSKTFTPIENARVSTSPASSTYFSDKNGNFVFEKIVSGEYSVKAEKEGHVTKFVPAIITNSSDIQVIFELDISTLDNKSPDIPVLTAPVDNAKEQSLKLNLTWTATDKESDPLTFTIILKNGTTDAVTTFKDIKTKSIEVSGLSYSTKYYWQVVSSDGINTPVYSVTNTFTTLTFPNPRFLYVKKSQNNNVIYTADEAGNTLQLSSSEVNSFRPRKNLQINKIAYISSDGSQNQIYTMNPDGTNILKVTNSIPIAGFNMEHVTYCWNTNGSQLIYPNFDKLYQINSDGSGLIQLFKTPNGKFISECDWSQDGSQIVLKVNDISGYNVEVYVINTSGIFLYQVVTGLNGAISGLDISVDNQRIVYTRDVSGYQSSNYRRLDSRIFIYNRITSTSTELVTNKSNGFNDLDVKFSPNEAEVIFTNTSNDGISINNIQKASSNDNGSRTTLFTGGSMPEWK